MICSFELGEGQENISLRGKFLGIDSAASGFSQQAATPTEVTNMGEIRPPRPGTIPSQEKSHEISIG